MPKRPRQAHIPSQVRKRKVRRSFGLGGERETVFDENEPSFADQPVNRSGIAAFGATGPVDTTPRVGRRMELLSRTREQASVRVVPGQLPVFERSYLVNELKRIFLISGSLLALLIVLAVVLR